MPDRANVNAALVEFVVAPPLKGIGASVELVKRVVTDDLEAVDLLDRALQSAPSLFTAGNNVPGRPEGNTQAKALRRLRKDAPELHAEVLAGRLSAHTAMVQAGFRRKTITVPASEPAAAARVLRKNFSAEGSAELIEALQA
jgi:hypothetical protein